MKVFLDILGIRMRHFFAKLFREATRRKYGWRSDLAVVSGEFESKDKFLVIEMESFRNMIFAKGYSNLRSLAGYNALTRFGVVPDQGPSVVTLLLTPSAVWAMGLIETFKFLKDWKGQSMVDLSPEPVVRYKFF
jgi:hypothetical protein